MKVLRVSQLNLAVSSADRTNDKRLISEFQSLYDDEVDGSTYGFFLQSCSHGTYYLYISEEPSELAKNLKPILMCEIENGDEKSVAKLMLAVYLNYEKTYFGSIVDDDTKLSCKRDGILSQIDIDEIISKIESFDEYLSDEYKLYGIFHDTAEEPNRQVETLAYGFSEAVRTADSLQGENVYFSCYDDEDGLLYFKETGYSGER